MNLFKTIVAYITAVVIVVVLLAVAMFIRALPFATIVVVTYYSLKFVGAF